MKGGREAEGGSWDGITGCLLAQREEYEGAPTRFGLCADPSTCPAHQVNHSRKLRPAFVASSPRSTDSRSRPSTAAFSASSNPSGANDDTSERFRGSRTAGGRSS